MVEHGKEMAVTAMTRSMAQSVKNNWKQLMHDLYFKDNNCKDYKASCEKWHWWLTVSCQDIDEADEYIAIIQNAYTNKINLDEDEDWVMCMRVFLPTQFIRKIEAHFTQVPMLAMMDPSDYDPLKTKDTGLSDFRRLLEDEA